MSRKEEPKGCGFCRRVFPAVESIASLRWLHKEFKDPAVYLRPLREGLPQRARGIKTGLYLLLVHNNESATVHDRNRGRKIVINANAGALKPGKFETGLIARQRVNYWHAHLGPTNDPKPGIYPGLIRRFLVLDLSPVADELDSSDQLLPRRNERPWKKQLRGLETCLKRRVREFLRVRRYCDPSQNHRSEGRFLLPDVEIRDEELIAIMHDVMNEHGLRFECGT